ncbi:MAG: CapA family protein [Comamonadaceae bacterium]|nr:CapA family protein [Comamonadaceae bacterium]
MARKEMYPYPTPMQKELFHYVADLGVSAVIGHHALCFSGHYFHNNVPVLFGLGNFAFDDSDASWQWNTGLLARITIDEKGVVDCSVIPVLQDWKSVWIRPADVKEAHDILSKAENISKQISTEGFIDQSWKEQVLKAKDTWLKILQNYNLFERALIKLNLRKGIYIIIFFLKALLNILNCRTNRKLNIGAIESVLKN